jgi:K+-transporting ATPase ATPase C chain
MTLWAIGQSVIPDKASGDLIVADGSVIGSRLIAQPFTRPEYFWPRPSAVSYDAGASGGSNLSASNPKLRDRVVQALSGLEKYPHDPLKDVPADLLTTSGSGLDPHITLMNAQFQLDRVADAWVKKTGADATEVRTMIENLLRQRASAPLGGLAGMKLINVLEVNLELRALMTKFSKPVKGNGSSA